MKNETLMATVTAVPARMYHHEREHTLECLYCFEVQEIPRSKYKDPEAFTEFRELTELDHAECSQYKTEHEAKQARRFRKLLKRAQRARR